MYHMTNESGVQIMIINEVKMANTNKKNKH